jgi:hypothetical protein
MAHQVKAASSNRKPDAMELDPWQLVWGQPYIDSATLAAALEDDLQREPDPDFRTRLLVRDAARALRSFWGATRFRGWLEASRAGKAIQAIMAEDLGVTGFPAIRSRLVNGISATQIKQILDLLGQAINRRLEINIAGSIPTLIKGLTARPTGDIDLVNEVPAEIRKQSALLKKIQSEYGLTLGHVQSHYLPANWESRRQSLGDFGGLRVFLVDVYDIFVSKLSSKQEKHQQDLRVLASKLDPEIIRHRLTNDGRAFLDDPDLRAQIESNWRFVYQAPLFPESPEGPKELPTKTRTDRPKRRGKRRGG